MAPAWGHCYCNICRRKREKEAATRYIWTRAINGIWRTERIFATDFGWIATTWPGALSGDEGGRVEEPAGCRWYKKVRRATDAHERCEMWNRREISLCAGRPLRRSEVERKGGCPLRSK